MEKRRDQNDPVFRSKNARCCCRYLNYLPSFSKNEFLYRFINNTSDNIPIRRSSTTDSRTVQGFTATEDNNEFVNFSLEFTIRLIVLLIIGFNLKDAI